MVDPLNLLMTSPAVALLPPVAAARSRRCWCCDAAVQVEPGGGRHGDWVSRRGTQPVCLQNIEQERHGAARPTSSTGLSRPCRRPWPQRLLFPMCSFFLLLLPFLLFISINMIAIIVLHLFHPTACSPYSHYLVSSIHCTNSLSE